MSRSLGQAASQVVVLDTAKTSALEGPPGDRAIDDLERDLRATKDEWARAVEDQQRLRDAAEAARRVSVAEAEARVNAEGELATAAGRIARLEAVVETAARARADHERTLAKATGRIAELAAGLAEAEADLAGLQAGLEAALNRDQGSLALATVRALRSVKDRLLLPHASARRSLYDKALGALKRRLSLKAGR